MAADPLFQPLAFRNLTIKNRLLRSNVSGRLDQYDGSGTQARINWELKFARNGVGAILSSWSGVAPRGRIVPNFATIERDDRVPFWKELAEQVHQHDCKYIVQLAHAGRQRDLPGFEFAKGLSATDKPDPLHGYECDRMTVAQIRETTQAFAAAARRAREAGIDGIEIHGANGYLFTQFLSAAINDREDDYGGPLENRARFLLETVRAIRAEVGQDYHLQVKISATEHNQAALPWAKPGNTIEDSVRVCQWLEEAGVDALHVSTGSSFPHPLNPAGEFDPKTALITYDTMLSGGRYAFRNYLLLRTWPLNLLFRLRWNKTRLRQIEGAQAADSRRIKQAVRIPVLCTGGWQSARLIREAIETGACDAVTIGRPLIANNDLVSLFAQGYDRPPNPCTYCNKCLHNVLEHPIGCYDERRYASREAMIAEIMTVFDPPAFAGERAAVAMHAEGNGR